MAESGESKKGISRRNQSWSRLSRQVWCARRAGWSREGGAGWQEERIGPLNDVAHPAPGSVDQHPAARDGKRVARSGDELQEPHRAERTDDQAAAERGIPRAGDECRPGRRVLADEDRRGEARVVGDADGNGPAIVPAPLDHVELVVAGPAGAMLGCHQPPGSRLEGKALRIAVTVRPHERTSERIVGRDGPIGIEPQHLPGE